MWLLPTKSLSPIETLDRMDAATAVTVFSGSEDPVTLPSYAKAYVEKARSRGITAELVTIPGKGHEILDDPAVESAVEAAARER
jgi:alpha-beta hydrolase superfamily lysophospholipase